MTAQTKTWLTILGATVILCAQIGAASARNLSLSNQTFRSTFREMRFIGSGRTLTCAMTLEGSFHARTVAKVLNTLMGFITRAAFNEASCLNATFRVRTETLPWHVRYLGFTGTLPNFREVLVNFERFGFDVTAEFVGFSVTCSYRTTPVRGSFTREAGGALTESRIAGSGLVPDQGFPCGEGALEARSTSLTVLNSTTRITVTLI